MIYMNGEIYEGYWKNNLREGKGKLYWINGYYDCNWVNDYQNGIGKIYFNDNSILKVKFINGKKEGKGILLIDNNTINLNFKNDVLIDGIGIIKYENGIKVIYTYHKDFYLIKKKIKDINEDSYEEYDDNSLNKGKIFLKYINGEIYNGEWENDKKMVMDYYALMMRIIKKSFLIDLLKII